MTQTLYAGMAGDTDEGRFVSAGLYRSKDGGAIAQIGRRLPVQYRTAHVYDILWDRPA
jgi:hypothetical protein